MATILENNPKLVAFLLPTLVSLTVTAAGLVTAGASFSEKYATKAHVDTSIRLESAPTKVLLERLEKAVSRLEELAFQAAKQNQKP